MNEHIPESTPAKRPHDDADSGLPLKRRLRASTRAQARDAPATVKATCGKRANTKAQSSIPIQQAPIFPVQDGEDQAYGEDQAHGEGQTHGEDLSQVADVPQIADLTQEQCVADAEHILATAPEQQMQKQYVADVENTLTTAPQKQSQEQHVADVENTLATAPEQQPLTHQQLVQGPKIWGKRRQGLCDALPYFKAHQGSLYTVNNLPLGLLIAKEARARDRFDGQVIITSVGGGRVRDEESGQMIRVEDQEENRALRAFRRCKEERLPLVVIAGDDHPLYPVPPPRPYCVLDYFQVTDVWAEKQVYLNGPARRVWCIRLEKIDLHTQSWWDPMATPLTSDDVQQRVQPHTQACGLCGQDSKAIFIQGWSCLNHKCDSLLKINGDHVDLNSLQYTPTFLAERTPFTGPLPRLVPPLPSESMLGSSHGSEKVFRVGIVCPDCGCGSSRRSWAAWECENCDYRLPGQMHQYPQHLLNTERREFEKAADRTRKRNGVVDPVALRIDHYAIPQQTLDIGTRYTATQYLLPGENNDKVGSVTVFHADETACTGDNGPNEIFAELCTGDIGLRRNPVTRLGAKTEVWTRHFAQNWGAPYKFAVTVQSKAFDEAPPSILKAVHRMIWAGRTAARTATAWILQRGEQDPVPAGDVVFNELLSLGYMEDDRISYHDDGEKELGPTVATMSLGSPAIMTFRPKKKASISTSNPPKGPTGDYGEVLSVPLFHGDLVVMHGTGIHRLYDHKVDPQGGRRFALTCRYIDPATMSSKEDQEAAITKGTIPADSFQKYTYNGDLDDSKVLSTNTDDAMLTPELTPEMTPEFTTAETIKDVGEGAANKPTNANGFEGLSGISNSA